MAINKKAATQTSWGLIISLIVGGLVLVFLIWWWATDLGLGDLLKGFSNIFK